MKLTRRCLEWLLRMLSSCWVIRSVGCLFFSLLIFFFFWLSFYEKGLCFLFDMHRRGNEHLTPPSWWLSDVLPVFWSHSRWFSFFLSLWIFICFVLVFVFCRNKQVPVVFQREWGGRGVSGEDFNDQGPGGLGKALRLWWWASWYTFFPFFWLSDRIFPFSSRLVIHFFPPPSPIDCHTRPQVEEPRGIRGPCAAHLQAIWVLGWPAWDPLQTSLFREIIR